jgi:uncharacterized protein YjbI with pentapeptide repeats
MINKPLEMIQEDQSASYQMIKDEHLASLVVTSQILAGSRVLVSTYQQVVFSDCTFYAVEFQGVIFENCVFENCNFEFSHIRDCKFKNCSFSNCTWKATSTTNTVYIDCDLDHYLSRLTEVNGNEMTFSYELELPIAC